MLDEIMHDDVMNYSFSDAQIRIVSPKQILSTNDRFGLQKHPDPAFPNFGFRLKRREFLSSKFKINSVRNSSLFFPTLGILMAAEGEFSELDSRSDIKIFENTSPKITDSLLSNDVKVWIKLTGSKKHGDKIKIGIIDTGFNLNKIDFSYSFACTTDASEDNGFLHGTHVAAILKGYSSSLLPACTLYGAKISSLGENMKPETTTSRLISALLWAQAHGCKICTVSYEIEQLDKYPEALLALQRVVKKLRNNGCAVFAGIGNGSLKNGISELAACEDAIAVGAVFQNLVPCHQPKKTDRIDCAGPYEVEVADASIKFSGTSAATPVAAGVFAMFLEKYKGLTFEEIVKKYYDGLEKFCANPGFGKGLVRAPQP